MSSDDFGDRGAGLESYSLWPRRGPALWTPETRFEGARRRAGLWTPRSPPSTSVRSVGPDRARTPSRQAAGLTPLAVARLAGHGHVLVPAAVIAKRGEKTSLSRFGPKVTCTVRYNGEGWPFPIAKRAFIGSWSG